MRVGRVIGTVTLASRLDEVPAGQFIIVQPEHQAALRAEAPAVAEPVVAYDERSAAPGDHVGLSEGREAAMPFHPRRVPFDAYCAAIMDAVRVTHATE